MTLDERIKFIGWDVTPTGCHEWRGGLGDTGYPRLLILGTQYYIHRVSLERNLGRPLLSGMFACHTCDNPSCINAERLFEGTATDNNRDAHSKGRCSGGRIGGARFIADEIIDKVFDMRQQGYSVRAIHEATDVSQSYIYALVSGRMQRSTARFTTNKENIRVATA